MESWQTSYDEGLIRSGEMSGIPTDRPDKQCDLCDGFFYKLECCDGCGEVYGCKNCMIKKGLEYYCDPECMPENEDEY